MSVHDAPDAPTDASPPTARGEAALAGHSPLAVELRRAVERAAGGRTVVVRGPVGSGRRSVARALHRLGAGDGAPYVEARCAGLVGTGGLDLLLGSSGRTGLLEAARGGTLVLVGVEQLEADAQGLLAEALAAGAFTPLGARAPRPLDLSLVAVACDEELENLLEQELAYRLNDRQVLVPALATRTEDVVAVASALLAERGLAPLSGDARRLLAARPWIGGVDDLAELLECAARRAGGGRIGPEHLGTGGPSPFPAAPLPAPPVDALPLGDRTWRSVERALIERVLGESGGNRSLAARTLGFNRSTLYNKLRQYGLES